MSVNRDRPQCGMTIGCKRLSIIGAQGAWRTCIQLRPMTRWVWEGVGYVSMRPVSRLHILLQRSRRNQDIQPLGDITVLKGVRVCQRRLQLGWMIICVLVARP